MAPPAYFRIRTPHRGVVRGAGTTWGLHANGALAAEGTKDVGAVEGSHFRFGSAAGSAPFVGHLRRLSYWPAPLATTTIEVLAR